VVSPNQSHLKSNPLFTVEVAILGLFMVYVRVLIYRDAQHMERMR
jgi:hypothetical protein